MSGRGTRANNAGHENRRPIPTTRSVRALLASRRHVDERSVSVPRRLNISHAGDDVIKTVHCVATKVEPFVLINIPRYCTFTGVPVTLGTVCLMPVDAAAAIAVVTLLLLRSRHSSPH